MIIVNVAEAARAALQAPLERMLEIKCRECGTELTLDAKAFKEALEEGYRDGDQTFSFVICSECARRDR